MKKYLSSFFACLSLLLILLVPPIPSHAKEEEDKDALVVLPITGDSLDRSFRKTFSDSFMNEILKNKDYQFIYGKNVDKKLQEAAKKLSAKGDCDASKCLRMVAGGFGAEFILVTKISQIGKTSVLISRIEDVNDGIPIKSKEIFCKECDAEKLLFKMKDLAHSILPPVGGVEPAPKPTSAPKVEKKTGGSEEEKVAWKLVENSSDPADLQDFLDAFPSGKFTRVAKMKLKQLKRKAQASRTKPKPFYKSRPSYQAPKPKPKPRASGKRSSDGRYVDHGDGTITDTRTNLMWAKKDSYADLGRCQYWDASKSYVNRLSTGGHRDWRLPRVDELKGIYEKSKKHVMGFNKADNWGLGLDPIFADNGAYGFWSSEEVGSCCARYVTFYDGSVDKIKRTYCATAGVRAVRSLQ